MSASAIKRKAIQLGYTACGIIPLSSFTEYVHYLDDRIKSFPESKKLYEPLYSLAKKPEHGKSIIVCTLGYNKYRIPDSLNGMIGKAYLFDSRLSYSHEYRAKDEFETYIRSDGINILKWNVPARWAAAKAGLGKFGRNNFIYCAEHGSYIWIEAWVIDKELDYDEIAADISLPECSEDCLLCVDSCPTNALVSSYSMDRGKCVAQLSFYAQDILTPELRTQMGSWLYGCDACQDACPINQNKPTYKEEFPLLTQFEKHLDLERIMEVDENTYINIINPRFWYISKDDLWLWKCNALRIMINRNDNKYHHLIKKHCHASDERLRELALWGCEALGI